MDEMFNKLIRNDITPNQFYVLHCIKDSISSKLVKNIELEMKILRQKGFLLEDNKLSSKGNKLLSEVKGYFKRAKKATSKDLMGDNFSAEMKKFNELFPKLRLASGRPARSSIKNVENCFRWFFQNHDYSWDTVHKATALYIQKMDGGKNRYTTCSHYFVRKQNRADNTFETILADYCQLVEDGFEGEKVHFKENTFE